jgi:succinate dehydrogenase / fumarate reductase iron-sulfur subunit
MKVTLRIWRQRGPHQSGDFARYALDDLSPDCTLLEALDALNEDLVTRGEPPVAFDSDCREGICGACGIVVDGLPHGPRARTTTCQLTLGSFEDGATITLEPLRTGVFAVVRDLVVDRGALDRIVRAGGYVTVCAGSAPEANALPVPRHAAERALDAAACIGCGACVAACKNAAAHLFTSAKINHLGLLPQGEAERGRRVVRMVEQMDQEGFGSCSNEGECEAVCPKEISISNIARMNRDFLKALIG